jgi:hypothetical protein
MEGEEMYQITISRPLSKIDGFEYLVARDGKPLVFNSMKAALLFLYEHNYLLTDILQLDFNIEGAQE